MNELRINARLDEQAAVDLRFLREALGDMSITEVLKHSLHQVAQDLRDKSRARHQKQLWRDSGLIGALDDDAEDLSVNYKQQMTDYLNEKYPTHVSEK